MDIVINTDYSRPFKDYDNSLFEVYTLDYGDNYHRTNDEPTSEFERAVRNIKARYKDLTKFNEALFIYNEWMNYLAEKHGGHAILKKKIKAGVLEDYVPRKPRLKNIKKLKYLYKHNIVLSPTDKILVDEEKLDNLIKDLHQQSEINTENIDVVVVEDKNVDKISREFSESDIKRYKSKTFVSDAEFLESFFNSKNKTKNKKKKKNKKKSSNNNKVLIGDIMSGNYYDEVEESDNAPLMTYNGLLLSAGTSKDIDVYHKMDAAGWKSYKLMKRSNYNKRVTAMFKPEKKKKKKKNKGNGKGYDDLLIDIMTDNGYDDFEDFQKEMLSMTSADLFK